MTLSTRQIPDNVECKNNMYNIVEHFIYYDLLRFVSSDPIEDIWPWFSTWTW